MSAYFMQLFSTMDAKQRFNQKKLPPDLPVIAGVQIMQVSISSLVISNTIVFAPPFIIW